MKSATIEKNVDIEKSAEAEGTTKVLQCIESSGSSALLKVKEKNILLHQSWKFLRFNSRILESLLLENC